MKGLPILFLTTVLAVCVSCTVHTAAPRPTVPVVREIVADKENDAHKLLKGLQPSAKEGSVFILGDPADVIPLTEAFLCADRFDNATGITAPDGLPDFSGECFSGILDEAAAPYSERLAGDDGTLLREHCVKTTLTALDTLCFLSPYDREGGIPKTPAKLLILASSALAAYGQFDVDTLFVQMGCRVPVLSPLQCMMDEMFAEAEGDFNLGVLTARENLSTGVYSSVFAYRCHVKNLRASACTVLAPRDSSDTLAAFFDDYIAAGVKGKLDYLIVDAYGQDAAALREKVDSLLSVMNPESLRYRGAVSQDVKILLPDECVLRRCYAEMRARGLFSFRIAYPRAEAFLTAPMLIPFSGRYAAPETLDILNANSGKTRSFYVQD